MIRASTSGVIDFSKFDPWDAWWWRRLQWTLDELDRRYSREVEVVNHNHWVTSANHPNLTAESFDKAKTYATSSLNRILKLTYPWLSDKIGEAGLITERQQAIADYHEQFGRPGDPQYDDMVRRLRKVLQHKLTTAEKREARRLRRLRWQREYGDQQTAG